MTEKVSDREKLIGEIEALNDDQVLEVLEYISIMKTLRDQEVNPSKPKAAGTTLSPDQEKSRQVASHGSQEGGVLIFLRSHQAASK